MMTLVDEIISGIRLSFRPAVIVGGMLALGIIYPEEICIRSALVAYIALIVWIVVVEGLAASIKGKV